ncbi:HAD hydrolase-like protein [Uliginosibacterium sp. H3]|uniref:HAD hydrolase-like protein n=1 Tax=Uliginosibacterium silvisoli TaxID=3114758 RepID=A0ABU6JY49_9RHOO|nr:HAD hydrolase-like protein [Uliginosibacterium sp. H3]
MKYRLIAFDFDGTLADSFPFFIDVFGSLADAHGFSRIDHADIERLRGYDARALMRHVGLPLWKFPQVGAHFKRLMAADIGRIPLFDGIAPALQQLSAAGIELAVVSSNSADNVRAVLGEDAALITHFECGVDLFGKRHKLQQLLKRSALPQQAMLYIGDELRDHEAARASRIAFGAVAWGYSRFDVLQAQAPEECFNSVGELVTRLL